jgi:hypothetical protein
MREAVFGPSEYEALVVAALEQRITTADLEGIVRRKRDLPTWVLDPAEVVGAAALVEQVGGFGRGETPRWRARLALLGRTTWSAALDRLGVRCVRVVVEERAPAPDEAATVAALGAM